MIKIVGNTVYYNKRTYRLDRLSEEQKIKMGIIKPKEEPEKVKNEKKVESKKGE